MRAKSFALLVLALGCGLVASIGITQVMSKRDSSGPTPTGDTRAIFVAVEEIPFGNVFTAQVVRLEEWPKDKIPAGALSKIEEVEGRRARTTVYAGEAILENKLYGKGASQLGPTPHIPKGYRAVGVKVDQVSGGGLLMPGDRVDVLVHLARDQPRGIPETTTRTILQDIRVFAVNDFWRPEPGEPEEKKITAKTVQLVVTPEQAETVMLAASLGKIQLVMRNPEESTQEHPSGATPETLFNLASGGNQQREQPGAGPSQQKDFLAFLKRAQAAATQPPSPAAAGGQGPETPTWSIRLMQGSDVQDVMLKAEGGPSAATSGFEFWRSAGTGGEAGFGPVKEAPLASPPAEEKPHQPGEEGAQPVEEDQQQEQPAEEKVGPAAGNDQQKQP